MPSEYAKGRRTLAFIGSLGAHFLVFISLGITPLPPAQSPPNPNTLSYFQVVSQSPLVSVEPDLSCRGLNTCGLANNVEVLKETSTKTINKTSNSSRTVENIDQSDSLGIVYYYRLEELSRTPQATTNPNIRVPEHDDPHIIGSAIIRLFLSENGLVDHVVPIEVTLPDLYLTEIVSAYKKMRFTAGELNGKSVKSQIEFEVDFSIDSNSVDIGK
jgi:hypothetical protein